jgi:hypothetical protein
MTNEELIEKLKDAAGNLSYYNAAEGDDWRKEHGARQLARNALAEIHAKCTLAGIDTTEVLSKGHYLL